VLPHDAPGLLPLRPAQGARCRQAPPPRHHYHLLRGAGAGVEWAEHDSTPAGGEPAGARRGSGRRPPRVGGGPRPPVLAAAPPLRVPPAAQPPLRRVLLHGWRQRSVFTAGIPVIPSLDLFSSHSVALEPGICRRQNFADCNVLVSCRGHSSLYITSIFNIKFRNRH
jgi:hypothetical protein